MKIHTLVLALTLAAASGTANSEPAHKGRLGIAVLDISTELRAHLGAPDDRGVLVDRVLPNSPAARAGVRAGDLILEVDGDATLTGADVLGSIDDRKSGETVAVVALRDGQHRELHVTLQGEPAPAAAESWKPVFGRMPEVNARARDAIIDVRKRIEELERRMGELERHR